MSGKLKFGNREIKLSYFRPSVIAGFLKTFKAFVIFKHPFLLLKLYITKGPRESNAIHLRKSTKILFLSNHPDDIATLLIIFCRSEYGKIPKNGTIVDIGANIGMFSSFCLLNGASKVISIEPNKEAYETILQNRTFNGWNEKLIAYNAAMDNIDDKVVYIPDGSSPYNEISSDCKPGSTAHAVKTISLSKIIHENNLNRIDLLKLDCEGAEFSIIPSLKKEDLIIIKHIKLEYHRPPELIRNFLNENGFRETKHVPLHKRSGLLFFENMHTPNS